MQTGWLAKAGPFLIEHVVCPDYAGDVDLDAPAKGVLHTTQGGWDGSMAVFRRHYAPHFMVGPNRIAQMLPLGRAAAALEHPDGTPPTNGVVRAQIEIVGYSQTEPWLPGPDTLEPLAWLMAELQRVADIPLQRGMLGAGFRQAHGWLGHADVPNNEHWDPGALRYYDLLSEANALTDGAELRNKTGYWAWLSWYLGEGDWKDWGARNPDVRPNVPREIPRSWWLQEAAFIARRGV